MSTKRFKDFGSRDTSGLEPLGFALEGEQFDCVPEIPGKFLLDLVQDSASEDPATSAAVVTRFFARVLTDESHTRFQALGEDKDRIVTVETLGEIVAWLMEEYTNRPEGQPEAS